MLVGRRQAQRDVEALLAGARLGQSGVLVLRGEPGIGKSALLDDAVARASGLQVLRARGAEVERELPFAGLAALVRPLLDEVDTLPPPQAEALGTALALREGGVADRFAISAGVLTLLTRASEERPTVVLVADALLVLVALRPDESDAWDGLPVLDLVRLDPDAAREVVQGSGRALTEDQVARIVQLADGNPLVLRTLADHPDSLTGLPTGLETAPGLSAVAPAAVRRRLHALVAEVLPPGDVDRRAWHLSAAALGPDEAVADELDAVARRAAARGAPAVAASASERAARLSVSSADAGRRLLAAGEAAWLSGDDARAATVLDEALRHVTEPALRARVRAVTGLAAARAGRLRQAYVELLRAADQAGAEAIGESMVLYAEVVDVCCYLLDVPAGSVVGQRLERLLADPEVCARAGPRAEAIASIAAGMARTLEGGSGADHLRRGVALFAGLPLADRRTRSAFEVLGPLYLRESGVGRELVQRAVTERRRVGA